ncbi:MAG TPA: hypothetical protein VIH57_25980 [Bacteroidales bacterium]
MGKLLADVTQQKEHLLKLLFLQKPIRIVSFIRKHKSLFVTLLIVLFTIGIRQACQVDLPNRAERAGNVLIKTSPFIAGNASYSSSEKSQHHVMSFPDKVLFHLVSCPPFKSLSSIGLSYLTGNTALRRVTPSILGLICKLQI